MAHQVSWNKRILERFIEDAALTETEEAVIRARVRGWTITQQAMRLGMSEATINRITKRLKEKYDQAAAEDTELPKRRI